MSITDFGNRSKDEIIEYLIDEHNATERETAQLRQELAEARETIEEFKRMIFASRSEKKHVGYENPEQLTLMENETVDVKQLGLVGRTKEQILQELVELYALQ